MDHELVFVDEISLHERLHEHAAPHDEEIVAGLPLELLLEQVQRL